MMEEKKVRDTLDIARLIERSLEGKLSPEEEQQLTLWLDAEPENRQLYERMGQDGYVSAQLEQWQQFSPEKGWQKISTRMHPMRFRILRPAYRRAAAVVAGIAVIVAAALLTLPIRERTTGSTATETNPAGDLLPGSAKAYLLAEGKPQVRLNDDKDSAFIVGASHFRQAGGSLFVGSEVDDPVQLFTLHVPRGGKYSLLLEDGTRVWLNADSKLSFPSRFTGSREVTLTGEAYFDVATDPARPFTVQAGNTEVTALGTEFNVSSYPQATLEATLISGKAKVSRDQRDVLLKPGQSAVAGSKGLSVSAANIDAVTAWKDGLFLFRDADFAEVMAAIARWYDVEIIYSPGFRAGSPFSAKISRDVPISELLRRMEQTGIARFRLEGRRLTVFP